MRRDGWEPLLAGECALAATLESGQVFHWEREGACWIGLIDGVLVRVRQEGDRILARAGQEALVARYFSLDHPLDRILATFPDDPALRRARARCRGLRIVRQPFWECLGTFITSSARRISQIRQCSLVLRARYGRGVRAGVGRAWRYPEATALAEVGEAGLRACGLGYRARHLHGAACAVARGAIDPELLARAPLDEARERLMTLPGVGPKVADCVLLFACGRLEAFPVDTWMERVLRRAYFPRRRAGIGLGRLREFARERFGEYAGYAQQYLFHDARLGAARDGGEFA